MRQPCPRRFGSLLQANAARLALGLALGLLILCVAIKSAKLDSELTSWIQRTSRIETELNYVSAALGDVTGSTSQLLIQTPREQRADVLTVDALMVHLEAMAIATHITVDLFDVSWSLKDLCFTPTLPDYDSFHVSIMLDHMMPCAIKTPLDCFWEGAKLLGPEQPVSLSSIGPKFKWTSLNPKLAVEALQRSHPHASFPYAALLDWMHRVGITNGYQQKPCLDPTDPNCPITAPNKLSGEAPNIGARLTGGCRGLAANQMHWKEEEIVSGVVRNKSGHIVRANALQSTVQLMGEQDMYDYWRKTSKVQDVNNWSTEKAKLVLHNWQRRFKEELAQFTRTSKSPSSYKIHSLTSKSMLEPIDVHSLLDLTNFVLCFTLMTIFICIAYPSFSSTTSNNEPTGQVTIIGCFKRILLAVVTSSFVGLTFIASLGLSSFMNLTFNMATTQILPPLALYYGFHQFTMIANIYSQKFRRVPIEDLTTECLNEFIPIITIESISCIIAFLVATIIPVPATRVFAFQAITFILLSTLAAIVLMSSFMTAFLVYHSPEPNVEENYKEFSCSITKPRIQSLGKYTIKSGKRGAKQTQSDDSNIEDQLFSRIQDDLKNIQADSRRPTDINFSAHLGAEGFRTSFRFKTSQTSKRTESQAEITQNSPYKSEKKSKIENSLKQDNTDQNSLPDLLAGALPKSTNLSSINDCSIITKSKNVQYEQNREELSDISIEEVRDEPFLFKIYAENITKNKFVQVSLCFFRLCLLVAMVSNSSKVKYGLQLKDIISQGTAEYESFLIQERYFPVYNIFAVTKGNFDYPTNQKLLYDFYKKLEQVDGIVRDEDTNWSKFWLIRFRDWLLEIQQKFDIDRNNSSITCEGWTQDATEAAKLAYKLLAQTGRVDNPVDKSQVEFTRLVDTNGLINPKAFYYYLTAWVTNDAFTYATSEASFKPEPKIWNDNPDDLKIEKARPLTYAQIPFLMKLSTDHDTVKTISEIRGISRAFEQLNLPNFPTGIPFIFWDQFINLDILLFIAVAIGITSIFIVIGLTITDFNTAAIITIPIMLTMLELYSFLGYISIPFNNILAVLLISTIGTATIQTVHYTTYFEVKDGDLATRTLESLRYRLRIVITSLTLFFICVLVFYYSKIDFMIKYACLLIYLGILNSLNSLLLTPVILSIFGSKYKPSSCSKIEHQTVKSSKKVYRQQEKNKHRVHKKRSYPRVQSEISLSTISEEPQSEAQVHDLKFDFSIRCY